MDNDRKVKLGIKFKTAGASGKKVHIISSDGNWVIFKEGSDRAWAKLRTKRAALNFVSKKYNMGTLVIHKTDGSVEKIETI